MECRIWSIMKYNIKEIIQIHTTMIGTLLDTGSRQNLDNIIPCIPWIKEIQELKKTDLVSQRQMASQTQGQNIRPSQGQGQRQEPIPRIEPTSNTMYNIDKALKLIPKLDEANLAQFSSLKSLSAWVPYTIGMIRCSSLFCRHACQTRDRKFC